MTSTTRSATVPKKATVPRKPAPPKKAPARRPSHRVPAGRRQRSDPATSPLQPGAIAASWALGAGLVAITLPVLLIWAADGRSGAGSVEASKTAVQLWLLAHGAPLTVPSGIVGLIPLGLTALPLALLHRAGRHGARQVAPVGLGQGGQLLLAMALPYAVVAACLTVAAATDTIQPDPLRALLGALVVALIGAGSGVAREAGLTSEVERLPELARRLAVAAGAAVAVLLATGLVLVVVSLIVHVDKVSSLSAATGPGLVGGTGLVVLQLLFAPNAAVWGASWLSGPGFAVGVGTDVSPWGTTLAQVPAIPMLGALPASNPPTALLVVSLLIPLAAGVLAAVWLTRRMPNCSLRRAAGEGALVGPAAGLMMLALALVAGGPLGGGRLIAVGPSPWQVALAVAVQVGVWSAVTTTVLRWRRA